MRRTLWAAAAAIALALPAVGLASDVFVSPARGVDDASGTSDRPVATIARARDLARAARRRSPDEGVTVWLAPGDYALRDTFELGAEDSGEPSRPTVYRAMDDAYPPRLIGGRVLPAGDFRPVSAPSTLERIAPALRGRIFEYDLRSNGVRHATRPTDVYGDEGSFFALYANDRRLPLARFPNDGYLTIKTVLDTGGGNQGANWRDPGSPATKPNDGGTFQYRDDAAAEALRWSRVLDHGVWLKGYWRIPWQNEATRVAKIDTGGQSITFATPVAGGIGNKYTRPHGNGQERYWLTNLLEAVDQPGEWAVDTLDGKLYIYPPTPGGGGGDAVTIADADGPVVRIAGAHDVMLRGLEIDGGRADGIVIKDGRDDVVAGCRVHNVNLYAVRVDGGAHHVVQSSDLYDLGAGGVWLGGGDENADPRVPAGHRVVNNHIHHFSQVTRIYTPGVNCGFTGGGGGGHHPAVGMYIAHNLIHDTPHAGVLSGSWDNLFEFNEVFRFCTVSNDMGAFYCYDRYDRDGNQTFRYNFCHSSPEGDGIYFDNDHRDMHVYGNIVYLKSRGARGDGYLYKIGLQPEFPQTIDCHDNIAVDCNLGFRFLSAKPADCRIENNVAVACRTPFEWRGINGKSDVAAKPYPSGPNKTYDADPGFAGLGRFDVRLNAGAAVFKDLSAFHAIPVEKIGLYVDEFRTRLPDADEIDREGKRAAGGDLGYDIKDRN